SGHATVDTAVEATRIGAVDFLEKPITLQKLLKTIAAGLARPVITPALAAAARMPDRRNDQAQPLTTGPIPDLPAPDVDRNPDLSGHATVDTAVEATRIGAVDFLEKPITLQKLLKTIAAGLARPVITPALAAAARMPDRRNDQAQPLTTGPIPDLPAPVVDRNHSLLGSITLDQPLRDARDEFERIYFEYHLGR